MINLQCLLAKIVLVSLVMASYRRVASGAVSETAKPGCQDECGGVKIPFPFGIGEGCYALIYTFHVICDNRSGTPVPLLARNNRTILSISLEDNSFRVASEVAYQCYNGGLALPSSSHSTYGGLIDMWAPYNVSSTKNMLVGIGCDTVATVWDNNSTIWTGNTVGCITSCSSLAQAKSGPCPGRHGCCATSIFNTMEWPAIRAQSVSNYTGVLGGGDNNCSVAFLTEAVNGSYDFSATTLTASTADYDKMRVPVVYDWYVNSFGENCSESMKTTNGSYAFLCSSNSGCLDFKAYAYRCQCWKGFTGNPYLANGCQDIDECADSSKNDCEKQAYCVNKMGGYDCKCPNGYSGGAKKASPCFRTPNASKALILGLGIGLGSIIGFVLLFGLYKLFIRQKRIREREQNFKTNGGLLLQQDMSSNEGVIDRTKIFSQSELDKATDNFNDNRVLGRGGQGTVYKGMLTDGTIVAVKKSMKIDETQLAQFINEVIILSQINHRNIVKLFGCCLETEVPMLIYEFVPYGTLYQHIHHPNEDFQLTWRARLQIALECAGAIAYLHSSCSYPIYHRDIKSSNILLDEKYRAKISDFGTSRTIAIDKTHVTTCVQGTFGYLDPEFFQSSQFTDKSDVYSFGVVLLELLTSKRPIFTSTSGETRGLATEFVQLVETNANELHSILDPQVLQHCSEEEIEALTKLIKRCLSLNGKQRPTMKEVAMTLEMIKSRQGDEEGNSATEHGVIKQDGVMWTEMGMMYEGPCSTSTTSAFADSSYSMDVHPLLFDTK